MKRSGSPLETSAGSFALAGFTQVVPVGSGTTGQVFRARQTGFDRDVAVKVAHVSLSDTASRERFERERALTGRLDGIAHVVVVHEGGLTPTGHPYLVMSWCAGGSLADRGPLPVDRVLRIGVLLASALAQAHARGVVHRDIKPANVLLNASGQPVLADFGIAALTDAQTDPSAGLTPAHAAPEQVAGGVVDERSDVWSLASTLYTALSGAPPFVVPGEEALLPLLLRLTHDPLPPFARSDVPPGVVTVLERAMAKDPARRYAGADELAAALQGVQRDLGLPVTEVDAPVQRGFVAVPPRARVPEAETLVGEDARELARRFAAAQAPGWWTPARVAWVAGSGVLAAVALLVLLRLLA